VSIVGDESVGSCGSVETEDAFYTTATITTSMRQGSGVERTRGLTGKTALLQLKKSWNLRGN
jgi:hypothetical protein